ncbi:MAG: hypothetical protein ABII12_02590 [Planctomycetota bacterium]
MSKTKAGPAAAAADNTGQRTVTTRNDSDATTKGPGTGDKGKEAIGTEGAKTTPPPLEQAKAVYKKWLELPDDRILDFVFGVVFANYLGGDPVWGGIVGASGDTKTEILRSLEHDRIYTLSNLTPKTLISGLPSAMNQNVDPSLLPKLDGKILVVKDLTPLISGPSDLRTQILGQFRDAYDGSSSMSFGTGDTKSFKSRFGMLFGVTPVIESCWPVINALGERFLYYRCKPGDSLAKVKAAFKNSNKKTKMRKELAVAAAFILKDLGPPTPEIGRVLQEQIIQLADVVAKARTPVKRRGHTEEIEYEPTAEMGTRLVGQLTQLARGITVVRGLTACDESVMEIIRHVAASGIPTKRLKLLRALLERQDPAGSAELGTAVRLGSSTVNLDLEDLWSLGLVNRSGGSGSSHMWQLSAMGRERLSASRLFGKDGSQVPTP